MNRSSTKLLSAILTGTMMLCMTGCTYARTEPSSHESVRLTDHMTQKELERAEKTDFLLPDHPWEQYMNKNADTSFDYLKDKIYLGKEYGALIYGEPLFNAVPKADYDGGPGSTVFLHTDMSEELISYDDYEDLKAKLRAAYDKEIASGYPKVPADGNYDITIKLYDAVINKTAELLDNSVIDEYMDHYYSNKGNDNDSDSMYWQMDDKEVVRIMDNISEYHLYDEELDTGFVIHVTTPPSYDSTKSYPALVMTDAVWRFYDVPSLYDAMAAGTADKQYLVTIGFEYDIDGWDNEVRGNILCDHKKEFLDFITDNMMPYLDGLYDFDHDASTLFGHSQGGVFTHYAAFNYDRYENRPFGKYIIASPTFWTPYFTDVSDYAEYKNEYGYWERNSSYDKTLFITAGDQEDADYEEYYGDNDSTTEGVNHLKERLDMHGVSSYQIKFYKSHHYQYVHDMLIEYLSEQLKRVI